MAHYVITREVAKAGLAALEAVMPAPDDTAAPDMERLRKINASLSEALAEVMDWISGWSPNFELDDDWPATKAKVSAALALARGETNA